MSNLQRLRVQNVRSHNDCTLELSPDTTIITGKNGSGKTSLLEAVYLSMRGVSFKGTDKDIVKHNKDWYRIDTIFEDASRIVKFDLMKVSSKKQFIVNDKTFNRLPPSERLPVVLFEPEDLRLLSGSPARRRLFIDHFITQVDPGYHTALLKYERALKQRNNLLKRDTKPSDELFVWNVALGEYGSYIIKERIAFIERLNQQITEVYTDIAKTNDEISIHYSHTLVDDIKAKLIKDLSLSLTKDSYLGYTTIGPHRDDVVFRYNNLSASSIASRGENRTIVLALKYLEVQVIEEITNIKPIVLLDDVYSELDEMRQANLSKLPYQTIITATNTPSKSKGLVIKI